MNEQFPTCEFLLAGVNILFHALAILVAVVIIWFAYEAGRRKAAERRK